MLFTLIPPLSNSSMITITIKNINMLIKNPMLESIILIIKGSLIIAIA